MGIISFAIENPVKVAVGVILVLLFGIVSVFEIPVQLTPDVDRPVITVTTRWIGASPQEIESEIIDRQEDKLKSVSNLYKMTSTASQGQGSIRLEFPVTVDKDIAYRDVSDKLRQVSNYPEEVDEPVMSATDDNMANIIAWMMLYGNEGQDIAKLKTFVEDKVKPQLERAEGIAEVPVFGGLDREIQIEVDAHKLAARGLTFRHVEAALRGQNKNISAGTITQGKRDYTYRTVGEFRSLGDIEETIIDYQDGGPVRIRDVATVIDGFKKQYAFVRSKGEFVIALPARRETGTNVMQAMENLKQRVAVVNKEILEPRGLGLELTQVYDETTYIKGAIKLVVQNIFLGGLLSTLVLMLFLRSGSATAIVAVAIPICAVGTFLAISLLGRTLNVVMLAGMAFAVGMVVDNAIVVLENIYRHLSMGKTRTQAALDGTREVWGAILASTLTTMAVFLPVIFIQEEAGQLFKDIAIAISAAVGLSLVVSVVVIPPLAAKFLGTSAALSDRQKKPWVVAQLASNLVSAINRRISTRVLTVVSVCGVALLGSWLLAPAAEYLPSGNQNLVFGIIASPPGYSIDEFKRAALIVEEGDPNDPTDGLRPFWEVQSPDSPEARALPSVQIALGKDGDEVRTVQPPPINNFFFVAVNGIAFMGCTSQVATNVKPLEDVMNRAGSRVPGVFAFFSQTSLFGRGFSGGNAVDLEIRGDDQEAVVASASAIMRKIMDSGYRYPSPSPANFKLGRPEVQVIPDRAKAADLGLNVRDIGFVTEACINGAFTGEYNDQGDKVDMVIKVAGTQGATVEEIGQIPVYTPSGHVVPIGSLVRLVRTTAPQQINHIEEMNSVTFSVKPKMGMALQETMRELEEDIIAPLRQSGAIPRNVITALAGTADKLTQTLNALIGNFSETMQRTSLFGLSTSQTALAVAAVFLLLVSIAGLINGLRSALVVAGVCGLVFAAALLTANPALFLTCIKSRGILALVITYLLMAALFESFVYPFVIMFTVPLAAVGGFAALRIVHEVSLYDVTSPIQQLDVLTMLGFVILIGIVVNNAILIVHQALTYMRRDGLAPAAAVAKSVETRTRPICMSALTSVFGMFPLVVMTGPGSELYRGLGSVVLGGLLVSTVFTLIVVPAMLTLMLELPFALAKNRSVDRSDQSSRSDRPVTAGAPLAAPRSPMD